MASGDAAVPLTTDGVNFSNRTQALDFLNELLDDTELQITDQAYARYFWYGVGIVILVLALFNLVNLVRSSSRLRNASKNDNRHDPGIKGISKPFFAVSAIFKWITYPQLTAASVVFKIPPIGESLLLLIYLAFILILEFHNNHVAGAQYWEALGLRASWLAVAQIPLLLLLAGKNNLIGVVTGISYARLNIYHRWVSRGLLLLITLHIAYQNYGWNKFGIRQLEWSTDECVPTGWGAYSLLLWTNLSTVVPLRHLSYEFFVIQHLITFWGLIIAIMMHLPDTALYSRVYIYIGIGLWFLDRLVRIARLAYHTLGPPRATIVALTGGVTRIQVSAKRIKNWTPGSYVLLSIPAYGIGQSHPATIASIPSSSHGDLIFLLKGHKGFTKRLLNAAKSTTTRRPLPANQKICFIDGPYGAGHPNFASYDSVLLIAGGTGVTFTLPILLDIAHRASSQRRHPHQLQFAWVVKAESWLTWVEDDLRLASEELRTAGIAFSITLYVTGTEPASSSSYDDELGSTAVSGESVRQRPTENEFIDLEAIGQPVVNKPQNDVTNGRSKQDNTPAAASLGSVNFKAGRPHYYNMLRTLALEGAGNIAVATCGPLGLNASVRNAVARISREQAGRREIDLHVEGFWF